MKSQNVPLPEDLYAEIRAFAAASDVPAAELVRQAVDSWLRDHKRESRKSAIADYAREMAGTRLDLDSELEAASAQHMLQTTTPAK